MSQDSSNSCVDLYCLNNLFSNLIILLSEVTELKKLEVVQRSCITKQESFPGLRRMKENKVTAIVIKNIINIMVSNLKSDRLIFSGKVLQKLQNAAKGYQFLMRKAKQMIVPHSTQKRNREIPQNLVILFGIFVGIGMGTRKETRM